MNCIKWRDTNLGNAILDGLIVFDKVVEYNKDEQDYYNTMIPQIRAGEDSNGFVRFSAIDFDGNLYYMNTWKELDGIKIKAWIHQDNLEDQIGRCDFLKKNKFNEEYLPSKYQLNETESTNNTTLAIGSN